MSLIDKPKWVRCPNCGSWSLAQQGVDMRLVLATGPDQTFCTGMCDTRVQASTFGPDDVLAYLSAVK